MINGFASVTGIENNMIVATKFPTNKMNVRIDAGESTSLKVKGIIPGIRSVTTMMIKVDNLTGLDKSTKVTIKNIIIDTTIMSAIDKNTLFLSLIFVPPKNIVFLLFYINIKNAYLFLKVKITSKIFV